MRIPQFGISYAGAPIFRYELFHVAIYVLALLFYVLIFILLLIFSRKQPLYSRSATPFLSTVIHFLIVGGGILAFVLTLEQFQNYCIYFNIWEAPLSISLTFLYLLHYTRYIIIINIGKSKIEFTEKINKSDLRITPFFRFLKFIGFWYSNLLIVALVFLFIVIINVLSMTTILFDCRYDWTAYLSIPYYIILAIAFLILFIIDITINRETILTCKLRQFWREDIYYFRIEIFLGFIFIYGYYIIYNIIKATQVLIGYPLADGILYAFTYHLLFFFQTLFPLIITIVKFLLTCGKKVEIDEMMFMLSDPKGNEICYNFAKMEYSLENILCYNDIQKYEAETDNMKKKTIAKEIYETFLEINSKLEINCTRSECDKVKEKMNTGEVSKNLFTGIEKQLIINLADTFSRVIFDDEYKKWSAQRKLLKDSFH